MDEASKPRPATERARYAALYPMWVALFVDVLGYSILIPLFPFISEHFPGANALVVSLLLSTNAVFGFVFGPLLGSLSDKHGRKPMLMISLLGTTAGFLVFAFAPSIEFLFLSRAIDGIFGGVYPITRAVIGDVVPIKHRSKEMANMGVTHILASLVGPASGGILAERTGSLLAPGLLSAALAVGSLAITAFFFKETLPTKTGVYQGE
ncbi:MAG: MFS transporter, partial [Candidatus Lokiarchaeota archaeon]|nr:MFS transporter [Candidatus Lokiarchaeota archaeon]